MLFRSAKDSDDDFDPDGETDVLRAEDADDSDIGSDDDFDPDGETDVLRAPDTEDEDFDGDEETDVLRAPDTEDKDDEEATDILRASDGEDETTVLAGGKGKKAETSVPTEKIDNTKDDDRVIYSVVIVHTEESL